MNKKKFGIAVIGLAALTLVGCSPAESEKPKEAAAEVVEEAEPTCEGVEVTGDIAVGNPAKTVDGEWYCTLTPSWEGQLNQYTDEYVYPEMFDAGFTDRELATAQTEATKFLIETVMSNPGTGDSPEHIREWVSKQTDTLSPELIQRYLDGEMGDSGLFTSDGLVFNSNELMPPLVNDGGAQVTKMDVRVTSIGPRIFPDGTNDASQGVAVTFTTNTTYRIDPTEYVQWRKTYLEKIGLEDYLYTVDEEGQDFSKPLFIDFERVVGISYATDDIKSGLEGAKVSNIGTQMESIRNVLAYN